MQNSWHKNNFGYNCKVYTVSFEIAWKRFALFIGTYYIGKSFFYRYYVPNGTKCKLINEGAFYIAFQFWFFQKTYAGCEVFYFVIFEKSKLDQYTL